jgi:predicted nucleotidyltransferase
MRPSEPFEGPLRNKMKIDAMIKAKREASFALAGKHGATHLRLFGSVARGEAGPRSDVDFLVDLEPGRSLVDLGGLLVDLEDLLGRKVDVVTEKGLHWYIRDRVLNEAVSL